MSKLAIMDNTNTNSGALAFLCAILSWFLGEFDGPFKVILTLAIVDYALGTIGATLEHKLSSRGAFEWTSRKVIMFLFIGVAQVIGRELGGVFLQMRDIVIYFYIANEGISIIENADRAKVPVPEILKKIFKQLHNLRESNSENKVDAKAIKLDNNTKQI